MDNQFSNADWRRNIENARVARSTTTNPDHWNLNRSVIGVDGTVMTPERLIEGVRSGDISLTADTFWETWRRSGNFGEIVTDQHLRNLGW